MKKTALLLTVLTLIVGCEKDNDYTEIDEQLIKNYLETNNIDATRYSSGMYYVITKPGNGPHPDTINTVVVRYKGYLLNGSVFDQTYGTSTADIELSSMITGWKQALPLMRRAGKGTFFIPSELGYGSDAQEDIPAHSVLIYDIELVDIE